MKPFFALFFRPGLNFCHLFLLDLYVRVVVVLMAFASADSDRPFNSRCILLCILCNFSPPSWSVDLLLLLCCCFLITIFTLSWWWFKGIFAFVSIINRLILFYPHLSSSFYFHGGGSRRHPLL
ncbi:hypothetical protein GYMLUDRAFT_621380 [Collybiopsis luxurians FD-317 M1]|nr:hypothetical protein GYMLUDRAFT_621380 [Collybiopsis luxurians FD-317 M1]